MDLWRFDGTFRNTRGNHCFSRRTHIGYLLVPWARRREGGRRPLGEQRPNEVGHIVVVDRGQAQRQLHELV